MNICWKNKWLSTSSASLCDGELSFSKIPLWVSYRTLKEIQPVHFKEDQSWVFFGRNDAKAETPVLWPPDAKSWLIGKDSDAGRDWGQEVKGMTEDEMAGWHHWIDGREFEWTPGVGDAKPVNPKGNQSWLFVGRTDAEAETPILWPLDVKNWLIWKYPDAGKDWRQEEKGLTEDEMVEWHHWLNGHEFEQAPGVSGGQGSLMSCSP